ncbi:hypothetical protein AJ80_06287 [Polytolypa hystricis UAMH7299]|uniref:YjgH family protein n=1 Tax=Polytolypa hystricis (strain UAMH7299) TaxID=1447883 RepID=A0A2B7XYJ2_POLH7|nr:hypothetical protein AJ80_06287 [Polytolypa hystricis UAMH7299]
MTSTISSSGGSVIKPSSTSAKSFYVTSSPFEQKIQYYRGVRHGQHIFISGTTAVDSTSSPSAPQIKFPGDAAQQMRVALEECLQAVRALGGRGHESVVRVRMFVGKQEACGPVGEAYREFFGWGQGGSGNPEVGTAATMIVVPGGFVDDRMLVEVEVDAMIES